jgi:hypothetical protein
MGHFEMAAGDTALWIPTEATYCKRRGFGGIFSSSFKNFFEISASVLCLTVQSVFSPNKHS